MTALLLTLAALFLATVCLFIFAEEQEETQHAFTKKEIKELVKDGFFDESFFNKN